MEIRDVSPEELDYVAAVCLDPSIPRKWREAMKSAMGARKEWLLAMMSKGLQVSVAFGKPKEVIKSLSPKNAKFKEMATRSFFPEALIEYVPIEFASEPVMGGKSLFINCMWVVPPFWNRGVAKSLLERVIDMGKVTGGVSVLAYEGDRWFGFFPYMPASFFKKFGFKEVDRDESRVLLHLSLGADEQPKLIPAKCKKTERLGRMVVDVFFNSQCPWSGWMVGKIKQNTRRYDAIFNLVNTDDRKVVEEYGMSRGICIDGKPIIKRMASWKEIERFVKAAKR
nr:GNAT family N-acetyltransferase [Candidatus Njordarchaeum guaymaensis]